IVWNDSLACCQEKYKPGKKKPTNSELQKQFITLAKKTEKMVWLSEVFLRLPPQQSLNDV
ncbi:MAG: transposase, partial [Trichodesmium sp. St15_bin1_1]|nr:transposase [Trichodesmium sp. St15_bin1_1]